MNVLLLISSGDGPGECQQAVGHTLRLLKVEAEALGVSVDAAVSQGRDGPKSATVLMSGEDANRLADRWTGTLLWKCKSQLRPGHKRQNWFIGVHRLVEPPQVQKAEIRYETFRAGGPGGQHQNTTDSAVRATCVETGLSTVARDGRSQHRNKALATERLVKLRAAVASEAAAQDSRQTNLLHHQLQRGNPVRQFEGPSFTER